MIRCLKGGTVPPEKGRQHVKTHQLAADNGDYPLTCEGESCIVCAMKRNAQRLARMSDYTAGWIVAIANEELEAESVSEGN
jgi:hypothetical protein